MPDTTTGDTKEILRKVRRIELSTRHVVRDLFSGEYHSVFKGQGMDFTEVREYQPGDEIRLIDWNVSARMGHPFVKIFQEERELTVLLAVDISASENFGSAEQLKRELISEMCAVIAFSAIRNNDKVGLLLFSDRIEKYIPPDKGNSHILTIIRQLLYFRPQSRGTDMALGLEHLNRLLKKQAIVFVVSDFQDTGYEQPLRLLRKRHDLIAVPVEDDWEREVPSVGWLQGTDPETGITRWLNTGSRFWRQRFISDRESRKQSLQRFLKASSIDFVPLSTGRSYIRPLIRFFRERSRRR